MSRSPRFALALLLLAGCHSALTPDQKAANTLKALHSDRIKRDFMPGPALNVDSDGSLMAEGIWIPEPDDSAHALVFPEQTRIRCDKGEENCLEMEIRFVTLGDITTVKGPEETTWPIKSWDKNSLLAEYGPWPQFQPGPEKCQKHVLSIVFAAARLQPQTFPRTARDARGLRKQNPTDW